MKYLVTGGAGFIGSHLVDTLINFGNQVVVLDDLSTGRVSNLNVISQSQNFQLVQGSVTDPDLVNSLLETVDGVFHLAAAVGVQRILDDPIGSLKTNIIGTETVLTAAARLHKQVMLASTSEIYGKNTADSLTEDSDRVLGSPLVARWTYSESKAIDEAVARILYDKQGLPVQIVRLFNTVGPRQSHEFGMVIPRFFHYAIRNENITVHGDGSQRRVFCHVEDAVAGMVGLWSAQVGFGEVFNLGGTQETTILELAKKIIEITGSKSKIEFISYQELAKSGFEDMVRGVPSVEKLRSVINWEPQHSLDDILMSVFNEFQPK
jgi:UDP-glucose 4-epimerase